MGNFYYYIYDCPCGEMILGSYGGKLYVCEWNTLKRRNEIKTRIRRYLGKVFFLNTKSSIIDEAISQLNEYFQKKRRHFNLPIEFIGTSFQKDVWNTLNSIPYGTTISYKELAIKIDRPKAVRAVANAVGTNALSIIVPCHRVIGTNGTLTGFAGGLNAKRLLLELESFIG